jgi:hypothetical protein
MENGDGLIRILDARQFDDDTIVALGLDQWLGDAEAVDPLFDDTLGGVQLIGRHWGAVGGLRLKEHLETTLKIETLVDLDVAVDAEEMDSAVRR